MTRLLFAEAGAVRAVQLSDRRVLEVLAIPYGGPERRDRLGQYFSTRTNLWLEIGDRRPVLYMHGFSPQRRKMAMPPVLGEAEVVRQDSQGVWMRAEIDDSELSNRTWQAAERGEARASTGSVSHLERHDDVTGEVLMWPVVELSVFDGGEARIPVSDDAVVLPIRAIYEKQGLILPEAFEADEAEEAEEKEALPIDHDKENPMNEELEKAVKAALEKERAEAAAKEAEKAAMRTSIIEELKGEPKYRSIFNVPKETKAGGPDAFRLTPKDIEKGITVEDKKETHEFYWNLRKGRMGNGQRPDPDAIRVATALEETEADEGLPMVPQDSLNRIWEKRDGVSIARAAGITIYPTNRLIFNIPREVTPMTAMAAIAENAAYVINPVAFDLLPVTVVKRGTMVSATEELLEDQNLFQGWFERAVGRAIGLGENIDLYAACDDKAGVQTAAGAPTDAQLLAGYYALPQQYRNGAVVITSDATIAYMRALLIASPRAYGAFPDNAGEIETWMGKRVFADLNWPTLAVAGANVEYWSFVNMEVALALVERRGLKLIVDPYTLAGTGEIKYYPSVRYAIALVQSDAISNLSDS